MTAFATALAALDSLRNAASGPGALAGLSKPKFKSIFGAVDRALESAVKAADGSDKRTLVGLRRQFKRAGGQVEMHMDVRYENHRDRIEGWGQYWADLDGQMYDLGILLERLHQSASAIGARATPRPIVVRITLPEDEPGEQTADGA
ncbi:hypothetical protein [Micromonospora sp. NPDC049497]|uniref:hypothetical protein n=1 Tax=Micromonospora sp. NPDC049497 TaxID=3364273 RepID=UPI00379ACF2A